jgi:hypothetical protein
VKQAYFAGPSITTMFLSLRVSGVAARSVVTKTEHRVSRAGSRSGMAIFRWRD